MKYRAFCSSDISGTFLLAEKEVQMPNYIDVRTFALVLVISFAGVFTGCKNNTPPAPQSSPAPQSLSQPPVQATPHTPPPYKIYRQSSRYPTSVVVDQKTTDAQLRDLLWFFRQKVRTQDYKAIGLTIPTSINYGVKNWNSGVLVIFRGAKCATENFPDAGLGPCGYGDHSAAGYQWGINGDTSKDSGEITEPNGDAVTVFDYKDGWIPQPSH
ncbi:MAG: hypothetical protein WA634_09120 [Silvibacterium sp.]